MSDDVSEALRQSEQRYRTLFEQAPVGVFLYDADLVITDFNPRFVAILRSSRERLLGLRMRALRDGRLLPTLERPLLGETGLYEGDYAATTSDAQISLSLRVAPLRDAQGRVIGGMGIVTDVSDRMRALAALRDSEQRLALHVRRSPLGVIEFAPDGSIVKWNPSATRIFGWTEEEAVGKSAIELLVPPSGREMVSDAFRAILARRGGERSVNPNVTKDGRIILCDWYSTELVDDERTV
ncbi:MAG TPA: PAS domain-containing protein, partial [Polyangiaceae bacterium]